MDKGKTENKSKTKNALMLFLLKLAIIAVILFLVFTFLFGIKRYSSDQMRPALKDGDILIYYRVLPDYVNRDVVMVEKEGKLEPRRIVAMAGDTVDMNDKGQLIINGYVQQEEDIRGKTCPYVGKTEFPLTIGKNQVFVLSDNRKNGEDSRVYGAVNTKDIKGRVITFVRRRGI